MAKTSRDKVWEIVRFLPEMNCITTEAELRTAAKYIAEACGKLVNREVRAKNKVLREAIKPLANWAKRPMKKPTLDDCNRALRALRSS
jgi:hypothetical protein